MKKEHGIISYFQIQELLKEIKLKSEMNLSSEESREMYNLRISLQNSLLAITKKEEFKYKEPECVFDDRFRIYTEGKINFLNAKERAIKIVENNDFFDVTFVDQRKENYLGISEIVLPQNLVGIKNYRIYGLNDNVSHRDIVNFLIGQKVICMGILGLVLVFELIEDELPQYYKLLSPVKQINKGTDLGFEVIRDAITKLKYEHQTLFSDLDGQYLESNDLLLVFY